MTSAPAENRLLSGPLHIFVAQRSKLRDLRQPWVDPPLHGCHDPGLRGWNDGWPIAPVHSHAEGVDQDRDQLWDVAELYRCRGDAPAIVPVAEHNPALPGLPRDSQRCSPSACVGDVQASRAHIAIMDLPRRCVEGSHRPGGRAPAGTPGAVARIHSRTTIRKGAV
jgi:hypothetical protein